MNKTNLWFTFLPFWSLANGIGWFSVALLYILPFWGFWAALGIAFFLSLLQWFVLEHYLGVDGSWIWLSIPTYGLFLYVIIYFTSQSIVFTSLVASIVCLGLLGLLQRSVLDYYVHRATVWVVVSPIAGILGLFLALLFRIRSHVLFWSVSGIVYGCITGIALLGFCINTKVVAKSDTISAN